MVPVREHGRLIEPVVEHAGTRVFPSIGSNNFLGTFKKTLKFLGVTIVG